MHPLIEQHREAIVELAKKRGLSNVRVFGSMARGDATDASDVDLLVTAGPTTSGFDVGGFLMAVQELVGRKVDIVIDRSIYPPIEKRVLSDAVEL